MPQNFIECDREQAFLLPPSLRDWLPADHLAWFVIEAVGNRIKVTLNGVLVNDFTDSTSRSLRGHIGLQNHHAGKKREDVTGWESGDHLWEKSRQQGGENPVREAAERLAFGAMTVGKYFGDEYPNDRSLTDCVRGDKGENTNRHDREMLSKESPGNQTERSDVAERSNKKKRATTQPVNEPEADKSEYEISDADADGLEQRCFRSQAGKFKYARREIENRIDAGELVEKRNQDGKQDRFAQT